MGADSNSHSVAVRVYGARGLRSFADGYTSLVLPLYLLTLGYGAFEVGVIATCTLLGSGVLTLGVGVAAHRFDPRRMLLAAAALMAATGFAVALVSDFWPLVVIAVVGTLNPSSGDASVFLPLEHGVLARAAGDRRRTAAFARYSLVGALVAAVGALAAGLPQLVVAQSGVGLKAALQGMFVLYGVLGLAAAAIYAGLPATRPAPEQAAGAGLNKSRRIVYTLAGLFALDAFAGGFVVQSLLALWLYERYALSLAATGTIFFWTGLLSALSYLVAVRIADRIGLVNTMVFTHLPANVLLVLVPFMPSLGWAIGLLLARSVLSQMDVPTRSSYVMAVVDPHERTAAASFTAVPRSLASAVSPLFAGYLLAASPFGWPLIVAGALKIVYDLLLLLQFRTVRPPEEAARMRSRRPA